MKTSNFNLYNYATIAKAKAKVYRDNKKQISSLNVERPDFRIPRPCFGFIWSNFGADIRTRADITVDYDTTIFINRDPQWAVNHTYKNYCALTDTEIDIYLKFVSTIAGDKFVIDSKDFKDSSSGFDGITIHLVATDVPFKHVMVICNLIRYMYEWPEAYNIKQMLIAYQKGMFYEDLGKIFCLFESFMMNSYDQKISYCTNSTASFIPVVSLSELADMLKNMDVRKSAANYLEFKEFCPEMEAKLNNEAPSMWQRNKQNEYKSAAYLDKNDESLDEELIKGISKLYKYILMNECFTK